MVGWRDLQGYRHPGDRRPLRRRVGDVVLAGPPHAVSLLFAATRALGAVVAGLALFLPWHDVRTTNGGGFCWAPDCHGTATLGPPSTCAAFVHVHPLAIPILVGLSLAAAARHRRPRLWAALGLSFGELSGLVGILYASFDLKHLFDHVTPRWGQNLFQTAFLAMVASVLLELLATPILYLWARARLPPLDPAPTS